MSQLKQEQNTKKLAKLLWSLTSIRGGALTGANKENTCSMVELLKCYELPKCYEQNVLKISDNQTETHSKVTDVFRKYIWNFCTMDISISSVNAKVIFVFLLMAITCTVFCTRMIFYLSFHYWLVIFMSISATVWCSTVYFAISSTQAFVNVLLDCNIFDKAEELSVFF